ncbi:carbohydrate ABC transporter permease [Marisediminicola sp. LYQ85]|uniref:carbohydrate ABC transporter permease n=1 Tax=Marisediminicola sp. LYQ85 TaxID=3391062 RepID=UPI003983091F
MTSTLTAPPAARAATSPHRRRRNSTRPRLAPWAFLAPAVALFTLFLLVPIGYAVFLSFVQLKVQGGAFGRREQVFVGLDNYVFALTDPEFVASLGRLATFGIISVPLTLGLALMFALLLDLPGIRFARFARTAIFIPYAVPGVIATLLWGFMYLPSTSPFNAVLTSVGLPAADFLGSSEIYGSLSNIAIWGGVGFNMIIMYTALRSIPAEIYEAAKIDGANEWQIAWRIKIPLLTPALVLTLLFSLIATLQAYSEPTTLRTLSNSISFSFFPLMKVYRDAFATDNVSGAAAASVVLALGTLLISLVLLRLLQRRTFEESK